MAGVGINRVVAVAETVESQPRLLDSVTEIVVVPVVFQKIVTEVPFEGPVIVPPVTVHA
jgi:hypothetical protein